MPQTIILLIALLFLGQAGAQNIAKETLVFEFDKNYIKTSQVDEDVFFLKDSSLDGPFLFKTEEVYSELNLVKAKNLKQYVRKSRYYLKSGTNRKLDDYGLVRHLNQFTVFLKRGKSYLKVYAFQEME